MDPTDVTALRERYRANEDVDLVALALTGAADLTPVAREVLKVELATRNLVPELWPTLDIPVQRMSAQQLDAITGRVQSLPCPRCGARGASLNGFVSEEPTALMLVGLHRVETFRIGCQSCLGRKGAWRLFRLKPGQRWKPSQALRQWVLRHAALLTRFESNEVAMAALLRLDYQAFLQAIRSRE